MTIAISVEGLSKSYSFWRSKKQVLADLDFCLHQENCCVIFGKNGVGKTTFLKILSHLAFPDKGSISIFGKPLDAYKTQISFIPDTPAFFKKWTPLSFLDFFQIAPRQKEKILKELGLYHLKGEWIDDCSLGQKKRLGFAPILIRHPKILLMDEPVNGLDTEGFSFLEHLLKGRKKMGMSVVFTTHQNTRLLECCNHRMTLENGKFVESS